MRWNARYCSGSRTRLELTQDIKIDTGPQDSQVDTCRLCLKCDGTRTETRFRLSVKRTSPSKSAGASVQSTTGGRGVCISGSNAGYTMFRGSVKGTGYPLHSPVSPFSSPPVRHRVPSHFNWTLQQIQTKQLIAQSILSIKDLRPTAQSNTIRSCTKCRCPHNLHLASQSQSPLVTLVTPT